MFYSPGLSRDFNHGLLGDRLHSTVTIGAQPIWDPLRWNAMVQATRSLQARLRLREEQGSSLGAGGSGTGQCGSRIRESTLRVAG